MPTRRHFVQLIGTSATSLSLAPLGVLAQGIDQVRILYGFPAGSSGDSVARRVGEKLAGTAYTRNAAVVENKPGASGRIALETLKAAPADGSALAESARETTWASIAPDIFPDKVIGAADGLARATNMGPIEVVGRLPLERAVTHGAITGARVRRPRSAPLRRPAHRASVAPPR